MTRRAHDRQQLEIADWGEPPDSASRADEPLVMLRRLAQRTLPCQGIARMRCDACGAEDSALLTCGGHCDQGCRRAGRVANGLLRMIPRVPVRHWTLVLPPVVRELLAADDVLTASVSRLFVRRLFTVLRRRSPIPRGSEIACGAATLVHRVGGALNLNIHIHALVLDGVYHRDGGSEPRFKPLSEPFEAAQIQELAQSVDAGVWALIERRRIVSCGARRKQIERVQRASLDHRVALGPAAIASVRKLRLGGGRVAVPPPHGDDARQSEQATVRGVRVHAAARVGADDRPAVARLSRYLTRPCLEPAAFGRGDGGWVRYQLERPFADGTTHVEFKPAHLAARLAALVPNAPIQRLVYHGMLAPKAAKRWRHRPSQLLLVEVPASGEAGPDNASGSGSQARFRCRGCGAPMRVMTFDERRDLVVGGSASGGSGA